MTEPSELTQLRNVVARARELIEEGHHSTSGPCETCKAFIVLINSVPASLAEGGEQKGVHSLRVSVENDWLHTTFTCTAPEGSPCRMICTEGDCEYWETDGSHIHPLRDAGECGARDAFMNYDWLECHESTGYESLLYEGPIDAFWDGEDFQWRILAAPSRAEGLARECNSCGRNHPSSVCPEWNAPKAVPSRAPAEILDSTHDEGCECRTSRKETAVCICDFSAPSRAPEQKEPK